MLHPAMPRYLIYLASQLLLLLIHCMLSNP